MTSLFVTSSGTEIGKTYVLLPENPDTTTSSLQFKEYAAYLERALAAEGFQKATSLEEAEIEFGIRPITGRLPLFIQPVQRPTASLKHFIDGLFVE